MARFKILFVSANSVPGAALNIEEEYKAIGRRLRGKKACDLRDWPSATFEELIDEVKSYGPNIVHFSAHGSPSEEILLNDDKKKPRPVPTKALEQLFRVRKGNIRTVVFNSCFSARQARAIAKVIDCVVGVKLTLTDDLAVKFSPRFYEELALGESVASAFDLAMASLYEQRLKAGEMPRIFSGKVPPEKIFFLYVRRPKKPKKLGTGESSKPRVRPRRDRSTATPKEQRPMSKPRWLRKESHEPGSKRPRMGATPYSSPTESGVTFRVWAPHAKKVSVAGSFNKWSPTANPLVAEGGGFWSVDVPGATVDQLYKFVITSASSERLWRMDPYVEQIVTCDHGLCGVISSAAVDHSCPRYSIPAWNELVIYEMHLPTFLFGGGYNGTGSFRSALGKLDYLSALGINAIELMPFGEFTGDVSAGYNPSYIFAIEKELGGPDGFRNFVNEAHRRGIAIIVDVVYNHVGGPADDMWQFDGWSENGRGGIYFYNDWRSRTNWGETRFNYSRPEVRQYLCDNALCWLQERFADGLRWNSVSSIRNVTGLGGNPVADLPDGWGLLQWINAVIKYRDPRKISIAQDLQENQWITRKNNAGGAGFDSQWSARFLSVIRDAITASDDESRDMNAVANVIAQKFNNNAWERVIFTESHDANRMKGKRVPELISPGHAENFFAKKRSTLAAAALMTAPGIPMLFMGQEFLSSGEFRDNRELDWSNVAKFPGIVALYRDLIRWRRNWFGNTQGLQGQNVNIHHINSADKVIAYHRWARGGAKDDTVVILNFGNRRYENYKIGFPRSGVWKVRFNSDWSGYDSSFTNLFCRDPDGNGPGMDSMPTSGNIAIAPYSALILSQG